MWLTRDGEEPRLAYPTAHGPAPPAVVECARVGRAVHNPLIGALAVPVRAPATGAIGVLHLEGKVWGSDVQLILEGIAREAGLALEAANLYEQALAEKEKFEAVLDRIGDAVVVTDARGAVRQWNRAADRIFTRPSDDAVGLRCDRALGLRAGERELDCAEGCPLLDLPDAGGILGEEVWRLREDGSRQPLLASVATVVDPDGKVSEVVHSFRDVTRLKQADEAKTMFLATASHELKTPLTVIQGFAQTLLKAAGESISGWQREALVAIDGRATELNRIVDRLLLSSRIEAGRLELSTQRMDITPMIEERVSSFAKATDRLILFDLPSALPGVQVDPGAIATVIDHLLDNALKYSPGGKPVTVSAVAGAARVAILVSDLGIGMDDEQAAKAFERFWQADSSHTRQFGGSGIGLYIVRSLVEAMGGLVRIESAIRKGSTFIVELLRSDVQAQQVPELLTEREAGVADQSLIREFMRQIGIPVRRAP